jgi:hypothetical protein
MSIDREQSDLDQEPIGIVISRGRSAEPPPRFSAYLWADADEENLDAEPVEVGAV